MSAIVAKTRRPWFGSHMRLYLGIIITALVVGLALLSLVWTPAPPTKMRIAMKLKPPLESSLAGTDQFGRDIFSLLMTGAWNSLSIALVAVLIGVAAGVALGTVAAAKRGFIEETIMRLADVVFAFPAIISAIMIAALIGSGALTPILAIGLFNIPVFIRVSRALAQRVWANDFCLAAQAAGKGAFRITTDHVLPNIAGGVAIQATIQIGLAILVEAGLSFLGLSLAPPAPSWGRMLGDAQTYLSQAPWMAIAPGIAVAIAVLGFNLLGDGLRDKFDPRMEGRA
ncbi:ABC transporter permease [Pseudaminobacter salicylatoxidans]|uniref:ABC transporter permease n=1 Tax=Pseudaminobacter salicylatoxidans TaxID=93369 RepID=UPI0003081263|nr:ABC transporter permease [Pseudaminobacter salicylatoxidans]